jgi:hypothetical protein
MISTMKAKAMNDDDQIAFVYTGMILAGAGILGTCIAAALVLSYVNLDAWWEAL